MKRYYFRIYQNGDEDGDKVWVDAENENEARCQIRRDYWGVDELLLISSKDINDRDE